MSDLDKLKDLLFGAEKQVLDSISERVQRRELRSADVADILPEAIHASSKQGDELTEALRGPVGQCLQREFHEDPQTYSDALYPIMGPAIRKSIMHALRTFAQQINEAVEQSITPRGLSWRFQAWRAGVPFGEFVLQKTLQYRVEQAYLISRENGLLVGHAQHESAKIKDSDAVSAMFTAIQDFVKESFSPDRTGRLESADMGEFTLWAVHGPHALLVCVIRGVPPRQLRSELSAILERIHFRYGDAIRSYSGDTSTVPDVEHDLSRCLRLEARQEKAGKRRRVGWPLLLILLLIVGVVGWLGVTGWLRSQELARLTAALDDTPGIVVTEGSVDGRRIVVKGMRDPDAPSVASVAASVGLAHTDLVAEMRPFRSMEPEFVARREAQARTSEMARLEAQLQQLDGRSFYFASNSMLTHESEIALAGFAARLDRLAVELRRFGTRLEATVTGHADPVGGPEVNAIVAAERADLIARLLADMGWEGAITTRAVHYTDGVGNEVDLSRRRVTVELRSVRPASAQ